MSTTEAEYPAGTEATKETICIQQFLRALGVSQADLYPTTIYGDNQGANALAHNPEYYSRTKHIHGHQRFITEMVEQKVITMTYIPTSNMVADGLTKALPKPAYWKFMNLLGLSTEWNDVSEVGQTVLQLQCAICGLTFPSGNKLFGHLRTSNHDQ